MSQLKTLFSSVWGQRWKILFTVLMTAFFFFFLFPFEDLIDFVSGTISKQTQNRVQLTMDDMNLSIFPPGFAISNAELDVGNFSTLKAARMRLQPSPSGLLQQKPYGTFDAKGIFNGNFELTVSGGKQSDNGVKREKIEARAEKISLQELKNFLRLPIPFKGQANLQASSQVDFTWAEQPDADLQISVAKFEIPPFSLPTNFGPVALPEINLSEIELKGRLAAGKFIIDKGQIGKPTDEFSGTVKGQLDVALRNNGDGTPRPELGAYNLELDLLVKPSFEQKAGLFLSFLSAHKTPTPDGNRYHFRVAAQMWGGPPDISTVR